MKLRARKTGIARLLNLDWGFRTSSLLFTLSGLALFAFSAVNPATLQGVRGAATDALAPAVGFVNRPLQIAADYVAMATGIADLRAENDRLRQENERLREWYNTALNLQSENRRLSALLNLKLPAPTGFISARVISDAGNNFAQSVLILAGHDDGVIKGQAAVSGEGLIGRVIEAGNKASRILLLTDINSRVPVVIEGTDVRAILAGQNHPYPLLDHLPQNLKLQAGLRVVTSGSGGIFLPGLPVGQTFVDEHGQVYVQLFADLDRLSYIRLVDRVVDSNILRGNISAEPSAAPATK